MPTVTVGRAGQADVRVASTSDELRVVVQDGGDRVELALAGGAQGSPGVNVAERKVRSLAFRVLRV
ncbi:hypothetical protein A8926_3579 [Saccharopolyspora spinosa]|uniref:Uncharacterized protein n=1 Tax=Saccharopolyspora spinosa TaxID=60894 RepID=A0A2N3XYW1_SACSN|nr:hypothetical protein A8926_3579 [Saccharopolyspora spinosa]